MDKNKYNCEEINQRVIGDNPNIIISEEDKACPEKCYLELEKYLFQLFPSIHIPKPIYFSFKVWDGGTHAWKRESDYCKIYNYS